MPIGHDSEKAVKKRQAALAKVDVYLNNIQGLMDEYPSEYRMTKELVKQAQSELLVNVKRAGKLAAKAYHCAVDESNMVIEYRRIIDSIAPGDPVLKEDGVNKLIEKYERELKTGNIKAAAKCLKKLDKTIGGRGEASPVAVRLAKYSIGKDEKEVIIMISNGGTKDVTINSIFATSTVQIGKVELLEPVIRSGSCINQTVSVEPLEEDSFVINLSITYTTDLTPVEQKFTLKVMVK